jgi:hypothetical protein
VNVLLSARIGQLRADDDAPSLFERADEALYQAKRARASSSPADGLG